MLSHVSEYTLRNAPHSRLLPNASCLFYISTLRKFSKRGSVSERGAIASTTTSTITGIISSFILLPLSF